MDIILFRKAEVTDAAALAKIRVQLFAETANYSREQMIDAYGFFKQYFVKSIADESFLCWIATLQGEVIASAGAYFGISPPGICQEFPKHAHINNLYTDPEHRRTGIAKKLLTFLMKDIKRMDCERIIVSIQTKAVKALCRSCGFQEAYELMVYNPKGKTQAPMR